MGFFFSRPERNEEQLTFPIATMDLGILSWKSLEENEKSFISNDIHINDFENFIKESKKNKFCLIYKKVDNKSMSEDFIRARAAHKLALSDSNSKVFSFGRHHYIFSLQQDFLSEKRKK